LRSGAKYAPRWTLNDSSTNLASELNVGEKSGTPCCAHNRQLVSTLSHSTKNILQALRGGADVVEMGLKANNLIQVAKGWRIVDRNLEKIYNLTMNLLAYSKEREPRLEPVNPKALIDECVELIAKALNGCGFSQST
jgi:nitrogen-specific signal transduction histidine kinase